MKEHEAPYLDGSAMIAYSGDFASMIARMPPNKGKVHISDTHHIAAFFLADGDRAELGTSAAGSDHQSLPEEMHVLPHVFRFPFHHPPIPPFHLISHRHEAGLEF